MFFGFPAGRFQLFSFFINKYDSRWVKMLVSIHVADSFVSCVLGRAYKCLERVEVSQVSYFVLYVW